MKKLKAPALFTAVLFSLAFSSCRKQVADHHGASAPTQKTPSFHNVQRVYNLQVEAVSSGKSIKRNCAFNYGNCAWALTDVTYTAAEDRLPVLVSLIDDYKLKMSYQQAPGINDDLTFIITSNQFVPQSICSQFSASQIKILPGTYYTSFINNVYGDIIFNVSVN